MFVLIVVVGRLIRNEVIYLDLVSVFEVGRQ